MSNVPSPKYVGSTIYKAGRISGLSVASFAVAHKVLKLKDPDVGKLDAMDIAKLVATISIAIAIDDYAISHGWWPNDLPMKY